MTGVFAWVFPQGFFGCPTPASTARQAAQNESVRIPLSWFREWSKFPMAVQFFGDVVAATEFSFGGFHRRLLSMRLLLYRNFDLGSGPNFRWQYSAETGWESGLTIC